MRRALLFLLCALAVVLAIGLGAFRAILPGGLATQIGHNSEAFLFAGLVVVGIAAARSAGTSAHPGPGPAVAARAAAGVLLIGLGLLLKEWSGPTWVVTLNEPLIGAGAVWLYLLVPARSRGIAVATSVAVLAVVVLFFSSRFVLDQAESLVPLMLAPLALDVFDRSLASPAAADRADLRWLWIGLLLAAGLAAMALAPWAREDLHGPVRLGIDYAQRAAEAYWGWTMIHLAHPVLYPPRRGRHSEPSALGSRLRPDPQAGRPVTGSGS